jgi:tRNA (guanine-N7-)-methyltransferase
MTSTYNARRGRLGPHRRDLLERLWPAYGVTVGDRPLDLVGLYGRDAPLVVEIGSGMGEATAAFAEADPDRDYLAVEVHTAGIANLLALIDERGLTNVRIARGDALRLIREQLPPECLDALHVYFPDPWPKARHHKRRLIQPDHVALLRSRLRPGGRLHCATDAADYAMAMLETLVADGHLVRVDGAVRPPTRYGQRAVAANRNIYDFVFSRA